MIGATTLTVTNGEGSGGASAPIPFTFYNGTAPPTLTAISPHVTPFASPPFVMVNGSNFAPLGADRLRCVFVAPPGSPHVTGAADAPATFVSDTAVRCAAPEAPAGAHPAVGVVLGGSGAAAGFAQSTYVNPATTCGHECVPGARGCASLPCAAGAHEELTYYDPSRVPLVRSAAPAYGQLHANDSHVVHLYGDYFAPTGALRCRYGFGDGAVVDARFVSPSEIVCARAAAAVAADVPLVASIDGGATFSPTAARFTYYDGAVAPTVSRFTPAYGPSVGGSVVLLGGTNFAPHTSLRCEVGGMAAAATFDSATQVRCAAPPANNQSSEVGINEWWWQPSSPVPSSADVSIVLVADRVRTTVTVDDVTNVTEVSYSDATDRTTAASVDDADGLFTYYSPLARPTVSALTPHHGPASGGEAVVVDGANFAPVGADLRCQWGAAAPVAATFESHARVRCVSPPLLVGDVTVTVSNGLLPLRAADDDASAGGGGDDDDDVVLDDDYDDEALDFGASSTYPSGVGLSGYVGAPPADGARYTSYDDAAPAAVSAVEPAACDNLGDAEAGGGGGDCDVVARGRNFAPTSHLRCKFRNVDNDALERVDLGHLHLGRPRALPRAGGGDRRQARRGGARRECGSRRRGRRRHAHHLPPE